MKKPKRPPNPFARWRAGASPCVDRRLATETRRFLAAERARRRT